MMNTAASGALVSVAAMCLVVCPLSMMAQTARSAEPLRIGSRLELFVDGWLIDRIDGATLTLQKPIDAGKALDLNLP